MSNQVRLAIQKAAARKKVYQDLSHVVSHIGKEGPSPQTTILDSSSSHARDLLRVFQGLNLVASAAAISRNDTPSKRKGFVDPPVEESPFEEEKVEDIETTTNNWKIDTVTPSLGKIIPSEIGYNTEKPKTSEIIEKNGHKREEVAKQFLDEVKNQLHTMQQKQKQIQTEELQLQKTEREREERLQREKKQKEEQEELIKAQKLEEERQNQLRSKQYDQIFKETNETAKRKQQEINFQNEQALRKRKEELQTEQAILEDKNLKKQEEIHQLLEQSQQKEAEFRVESSTEVNNHPTTSNNIPNVDTTNRIVEGSVSFIEFYLDN
jgi:hypothetical protein